MGLNGGGYTFINPKYLTILTHDEVQAMFTDTKSFLMRVRSSDSEQPHAILEQLPQYQYAVFFFHKFFSLKSCKVKYSQCNSFSLITKNLKSKFGR